MARRNITDQEIGLIKAMIARGMKNDKIHFHFNKPARLISSGRITQIKKGEYGGEVTAATNDELDSFLASFADVIVGAAGLRTGKSEPSAVAKALFDRDLEGTWRLMAGETDQYECKRDFDAKNLGSVLRALAALSNHRGGFVFFGVSNDGYRAAGVCSEFEAFDIVKLVNVAQSHLSPTPRVTTKGVIDLDGTKVGFIHVESHPDKPVIVCRDHSDKLHEGEILFRYAGKSARIKIGDLRDMLAERDRKTIAEFSNRISRVAMGAVATLDLDTGVVDGRVGSFMIGEELLPKIQFIREGQFKEKSGAPALRLIGDVRSISGETRIVRTNITNEAALCNFLMNETVEEPLQYLLYSAHSTREWVPIWYYLRAARISVADAVVSLENEPASQCVHRDGAISRLTEKRSAYKINAGKPKRLVEEFRGGTIREPEDDSEAQNFALESFSVILKRRHIQRW